MTLKNKKVLVTGASGFIGSHLTERLLKEKADISIIKRENSSSVHLEPFKGKVKAFTCDLRNFEEVKKAIATTKPDIIFHLAAHASPERNIDSKLIFNNNLFGTINLFKALNGNFDLFVNTGTCEEYGNGKTPFQEDQAPISVSPYSASKIATTHYCQMLNKVHNLPIVTLRPFLTYGPRQRNMKMLIPSAIISSLKNEKLKMTKGEQTRDFIYVEDVVEGYIKTTKSKKAIGEIINIGSGKEYQIKEVVSKISKLSGSQIKPEFTLPYRSGETMHFFCSNKKANQLLGWKPKTSLEKGLTKTIKWFKEISKQGRIERWMRT